MWWALLQWIDGSAHIESGNCATRSELITWTRKALAGPLRARRTLIGFDFPFGFPRGFAAALGYAGAASGAWCAVWSTIAAKIRDETNNHNNRFTAAAELNAAVSGGFGPFYGRPKGVLSQVKRRTSRCSGSKERGALAVPMQLGGDPLEVVGPPLSRCSRHPANCGPACRTRRPRDWSRTALCLVDQKSLPSMYRSSPVFSESK